MNNQTWHKPMTNRGMENRIVKLESRRPGGRKRASDLTDEELESRIEQLVHQMIREMGSVEAARADLAETQPRLLGTFDEVVARSEPSNVA